MPFASDVERFSRKIPRWAIIIIAFVGLLIASVPSNIAWYHTTGTNSNLSFPAVFGISMFFVIIEYLIVLPANQLAGTKLSLVEVNVIEFVTLTMGSLFYLIVIRKQRPDWRHYTGLILAAVGGGIALS